MKTDNPLDWLDPLRSAALRGDVVRVHDLLNRIVACEPDEAERRIVEPSIVQSLAILDGRKPRIAPSVSAALTIAGVIAWGLGVHELLEVWL